MLKKFVSIAVSVLLMAGIVLSGGIYSSSKPALAASKPAATKLIFFNGAVELVNYYNSFFKTYNSKNKDNIKVSEEYQSDATNNLQVRMAAGDYPDIINAGVTQDMIDAKEFVDLTKLSWWKSLSSEMKSYSTDVKSGKTYVIPLLKSFVGLYYNKTIFKACGITPANTWDEFVSNLKAIKAKYPDVVPFYMGGKDSWMLQQMSDFTMLSPAMQKLSYVAQQKAMQGGNLKALGWDTSSSGAIATFAADLMELQSDGLVNSNIVTATYDNQTTAFASGQAAIIGNGLWAMSNIAGKIKDTSFVGLSQYPSMMSGVKPAIGFTTDGSICISSHSRSVKASEKVVAYMLQPANMKALSVQKSEPSSNPSVVSNWGVLSSDATKITNDKTIAKLDWAFNPSGFSGDAQGSMIQSIFAGAYSKSTDFATAWVSAYNKGLGK